MHIKCRCTEKVEPCCNIEHRNLIKEIRYGMWDITQCICILWIIKGMCIYHQQTLTMVHHCHSLLGYNHSWKTDQYHENLHDSTHWGCTEISTCVSLVRQTDKITVLSTLTGGLKDVHSITLCCFGYEAKSNHKASAYYYSISGTQIVF
jgi:hypothetical protein